MRTWIGAVLACAHSRHRLFDRRTRAPLLRSGTNQLPAGESYQTANGADRAELERRLEETSAAIRKAMPCILDNDREDK